MSSGSCHFHARAMGSVVSFTHEQNILFAAQHSWTTLGMIRQLFVRSRGGLSADEKEKIFSSSYNGYSVRYLINMIFSLLLPS